jgi:hypothetical protein
LTLIRRALVDSSEVGRSAVLTSHSPDKKKDAAQEQVTQRKLKKLMGLSADEEFRVTTAIDAPKPTWKELEHLKSELLKSCTKKKDVVRIAATVGFVDSTRSKPDLKWVTLYTGEANEVDMEHLINLLTEKSRPLTLYTLRVQKIEVVNKQEKFKTSGFVVHMTGAEAPRVIDTAKRQIKVAWPTLNTSRVGDCDIKLSLEICKGREWRSGKCRQSANTLSLLSSSGKRAFRSVYSVDVGESIRQGLGKNNQGSQNQQSITVTDLNPAYWYHMRFKVSYRVLPSIHSTEEVRPASRFISRQFFDILTYRLPPLPTN